MFLHFTLRVRCVPLRVFAPFRFGFWLRIRVSRSARHIARSRSHILDYFDWRMDGSEMHLDVCLREYDDVPGAHRIASDTETLNQRKYQLKEKWYGDEVERAQYTFNASIDPEP